MGVKVKSLTLDRQSGSDNTYFASWSKPTKTTRTPVTDTIKKGTLVYIKSGAKYWNGTPVPSWVIKKRWYISSYNKKKKRYVLGKSQDKKHNIKSAIHLKYLYTGTQVSGTSTQTNIKEYKIIWRYSTGDGIAYTGSESTVTQCNATYSPPDNATSITVYVKPVSKTYTKKVNKKTKTYNYWTGEYVSKTLSVNTDTSTRPTAPSALSVEIEKLRLTATVANIDDARTDYVEFEVYEDVVNGNATTSKKVKSGKVEVTTLRAVYTVDVSAGKAYRVRCRAVNSVGKRYLYSEWTNYSEAKDTIPASVTNLKAAADSKTSVKLTWNAVSAVTSYKVEYATNKLYFDQSSSVSSTTVTVNSAYITGLEGGHTYYFRVSTVNDKGSSGWSDIVSAIVGTKPEPPTTWSLTTTAHVGEDVVLYWTHNSEDGSKQTEAQISLTVNGSTQYLTVTSSVSEDEDEPVYSYTVPTSSYTDGGAILWMVKTKGVTAEYSDWSTQRTVEIFAAPTIALTTNIIKGQTVTDTDGNVTSATDDHIESFPLTFTAETSPSTQNPLSYHISLTAANSYETVDNVGNDTYVLAGSTIYSKTIIPSEADGSTLTHSISAGDVSLSSGQSYTLTVLAAMDSGLTATATAEFMVEWEARDYICDAYVTVDEDNLSAMIMPFCVVETYDSLPLEAEPTGTGTTESETEVVYDPTEDPVLEDNVTLAVYRREADGSFTEIATDIVNDMASGVTDPHPSLDVARYRIVATDKTTGVVEYSDIPGEPVDVSDIVMQWDESWSDFEHAEDDYDDPDVPSWTGSMLRLPYNVDVTEKSDPDVALIEYIGRKYPVSYYGTQRGETGSWSTDIDKNDVDTLYALRRLKAWSGDVYVREPSGLGYWANVNVSLSIKHKELVIPVSFEITRVEGGA